MSVRNATIRRTYDFEAAHSLPHVADGHKCKRVHGHSYRLHVFVTGPVGTHGEEMGMVVDFGIPDAAWAKLHARIDHTTLNESLHENPTVENMAPIIWEHFSSALTEAGNDRGCVFSVRVELEEGPRSWCCYP